MKIQITTIWTPITSRVKCPTWRISMDMMMMHINLALSAAKSPVGPIDLAQLVAMHCTQCWTVFYVCCRLSKLLKINHLTPHLRYGSRVLAFEWLITSFVYVSLVVLCVFYLYWKKWIDFTSVWVLMKERVVLSNIMPIADHVAFDLFVLAPFLKMYNRSYTETKLRAPNKVWIKRRIIAQQSPNTRRAHSTKNREVLLAHRWIFRTRCLSANTTLNRCRLLLRLNFIWFAE